MRFVKILIIFRAFVGPDVLEICQNTSQIFS